MRNFFSEQLDSKKSSWNCFMVIVWFISQTRNICASTEYYNVNTVWHVATFTMQILLKEKLSTTIICLNILSVQMHFKMKSDLWNPRQWVYLAVELCGCAFERLLLAVAVCQEDFVNLPVVQSYKSSQLWANCFLQASGSLERQITP